MSQLRDEHEAVTFWLSGVEGRVWVIYSVFNIRKEDNSEVFPGTNKQTNKHSIAFY